MTVLYRYLRFFLVAMLFCVVVHAEDKGLAEFDEAVVTVLPPLPDSGYNKLSFELYDYNTKEKITDIHVKIEIIKDSKRYETLKYVDEEGILELDLEDGIYDITFKVDKIGTNGQDFFITIVRDVDSDFSEKLYLLPVGSLRGFVYDPSGNAIRDANVKFYCSGNYGEIGDVKTDSFGTFTSSFLPLGNCLVSAEYDDDMGNINVDIKQGEISDVEIILKGRLLRKNNLIFYFIGIIVIMTVLLAVFYGKKKPIKNMPSKRTDDILNTLDDKEKKVVDCLMKSDNCSSQAKISFNTGIAKTSLVRVLERLEKKNVISIEKHGKFKKIHLTDWFLGKGEIKKD